MRLIGRLPTHAAPIVLRVAAACVLILPFALMYARALAEILIGAVDGLYLFHLWASTRHPPRTGFILAASAWWLWLVFCSAIGTGGLLLALVAFRLPLFAVALGDWVLCQARTRRILWWVLAGCAAWIILQSWQQALLGRNIFGQARWGDGALTGPFNRPRAGPALILILYPVLLPAASWLFAHRRFAWRAAGALLAGIGAASVLLIGQRMPSLLMVLGLAATALLLPRLRPAAAAAAILGAALVGTLPAISPGTYHKLITRTREQAQSFVYSPYGEIWVRATVLAEQHPWTGLGFDGFRRHCNDPAAIQGLPELGVTLAEARRATDACNIHPHNYYLEALDDGGVPLLLCFCAMAATLLATLARGVRRGLSPVRAGLLVALTLALWPVASTSAFTSMPNAGWLFLLGGYGIAERRPGGSAPCTPAKAAGLGTII